MLIEANALKYWLDNFYGYGSWRARFWFVSCEEPGDVPEEVAEKLKYSCKVQGSNRDSLCDIRELYAQVAFRLDGPRAERFINLNDQRFGRDATLHGGWKNLITFVHGYQNQQLPDLLTYQKNSFASSSSRNEALIPLFPLPAHNHAWHYAWLELAQFPFLKSRALYQDYLYSKRINQILKNITVYKPEVVVMYGMDNINLLKKSVQEFFPNPKFKMVKAIKLEIPKHHRADFNGTTLVITTQIPALRHNRVETGFDWYEFGKLLKEV